MVENDVKKLLVNELIFGPLSDGGDAVLDVKDDKLVIIDSVHFTVKY